LTQYPDQLPPDLPNDVRHFRFVPLSRLLKRSAAIVHMGGIGTMAQGIAAGVPQLIVPIAVDQPDNASRLEDLGAGRSISVTDYCQGLGTALLSDLLDDPGTANNCAQLAAKCDGLASIGAACDAIEALI
jgi:UDP:flavonoid glycosyltransferase YjiC (YdhE family)